MANRQLYPRVLFFIEGPTPSPEELDEANRYGPGVAFRNALMIQDDAPLEAADAVAGVAPQQYKDAFPGIDDHDAIKERMEERNPNNPIMRTDVPKPYSKLTDVEREERIARNLQRGSNTAPINERHGQPLAVEHRLTQAGTPRIDTTPHPHALPGDADHGWTTDPSLLGSGASHAGEGAGEADQQGGTPAAAPPVQQPPGGALTKPATPIPTPAPATKPPAPKTK